MGGVSSSDRGRNQVGLKGNVCRELVQTAHQVHLVVELGAAKGHR